MAAVGDVIAGVRIEELAAHGGSSTVFRGIDAAHRAKAVKVLRDPDQSARERLHREANLMRGLDHPALITLDRVVEHDEHLVLISEWVDGRSLLELLRAGEQVSVTDATRLLDALADGLDYLHHRNIVHRDVSPANILLRSDGSPVLIDLGIGHVVGESTMTNVDLVAGTPKYLAPEIIRGETATARADQYSLAVVLYELIAGASPFPAGEALATALHHQIYTDPIPLDETQPAVPAFTASAIGRALSKDPRDRFESIADFAEAARTATMSPSRARRSKAVAGAAVGAALAGLLVLGWLATQRSPETARVELSFWNAGRATTVACNQLEGDVFENGSVPLDYFGDPPGRERVVDAGGYDNSWALEVGVANNFGQYGEIIPVTPGQSYVFSGWFFHEGDVVDAEMGISLLDAGYQGLDVSASTDLSVVESGFAQTRLDDIPASAAFAVPYLFKDSSPGVLLADELVFGVQSSCQSDLADLTNPDEAGG